MKHNVWVRNPLFTPVVLSMLSVALLSYRVVANSSTRLSFMVWNLVLAWVPLMLALWLRQSLKLRRWQSAQNMALSAAWLLFLPNSFYLITDLIHIRSSALNTLLFDSVLLMMFALTGMVLGCLSLYVIHLELLKRRSVQRSWVLVAGIVLLSSIAMYMGRYVGWNSWDIVVRPQYILLDLSERLTEAKLMETTAGTVLLLFVCVLVIYGVFFEAITTMRIKK